MNLKYFKIFPNSNDINKVKALYEDAFPEEERPPFDLLMSFNHHDLFSIYLDHQFVGLIDLVFYEDLIYLFFLAITPLYRHQGIGSNILKQLLDKYKDRRIFLLAEEVDEKYPNYLERKNRISFYEHNNLIISSTIIKEMGINYHLLTNHKIVLKQEFLSLMKYLIGEDNFKNYYRVE